MALLDIFKKKEKYKGVELSADVDPALQKQLIDRGRADEIKNLSPETTTLKEVGRLTQPDNFNKEVIEPTVNKVLSNPKVQAGLENTVGWLNKVDDISEGKVMRDDGTPELVTDLPMAQQVAGSVFHVAKNIGRGAIGTAESTLRGFQWLGVDSAKPLADKLSDWQSATAPEDIKFSDNLAAGIGSAVSFFVPGIGAMKGAEAVGVFSPRLAMLFGNSAMTAFEAMAEAGDAYQSALTGGKSKKQASDAATKTFWANAVLIGLTNKLAYFNKIEGVKKLLISSPIEGLQEFGQQVIQNAVSGKQWDEGAYEAGAIGAILGGILGGHEIGMETIREEDDKKEVSQAAIPDKYFTVETKDGQKYFETKQQADNYASANYAENTYVINEHSKEDATKFLEDNNYQTFPFENGPSQAQIKINDAIQTIQTKTGLSRSEAADVFGVINDLVKTEKAPKITPEIFNQAVDQVKMNSGEEPDIYKEAVAAAEQDIAVPASKLSETQPEAVDLFHQTPEDVEAIKDTGFVPSKNSKWGEAAYHASMPDKTYGENQIKINSKDFSFRTFNGRAQEEAFIEKWGGERLADAVRNEGKYDGFILKQKPGSPDIYAITNFEKYNDVLKKQQFITNEEAEKQIKSFAFIKALDLPSIIREKILTEQGKEAFGRYYNGVIEFINNPHKTTVPHEAVHAFLDLMLTDSQKQEVLDEIKRRYPGQKYDNRQAEERLADDFAKYYIQKFDGKQAKAPSSKLRQLFDWIIKQFKALTKPETRDAITNFYEEVINKKPGILKKFEIRQKITRRANDIANLQQKYYSDPDALTTKFLENVDVKNRETASYSFLKNLLKSKTLPLKEVERNLISDILDDQFKDQKNINMDDFRAAVRSELMPLQVIESGTYDDYGSRNVDREISHNYETHIYNSPFEHGYSGHFHGDFGIELNEKDIEIKQIPTTDKWAVVRAGVDLNENNIEENVFHVSETEEGARNWLDRQNTSGSSTEGKFYNLGRKGLFGHARIWDPTTDFGAESLEATSRYVAEIQSDAFQNIEELTTSEKNKWRLKNAKDELKTLEEHLISIQKINADDPAVERTKDLIEQRKDEINLLEKEKKNMPSSVEEERFMQFRNTWHERIIREEIRRAAMDGKARLRFPTPYTISKIEGYFGGEDSRPYEIIDAKDNDRLSFGDTIDYGGEEYTVLSDDPGQVIAAPTDKINNFLHSEYVDEEATSRWEDIIYNFKNLEEDFGPINTGAKAQKVIDKIEQLNRYIDYKNADEEIAALKERIKETPNNSYSKEKLTYFEEIKKEKPELTLFTAKEKLQFKDKSHTYYNEAIDVLEQYAVDQDSFDFGDFADDWRESYINNYEADYESFGSEVYWQDEGNDQRVWIVQDGASSETFEQPDAYAADFDKDRFDYERDLSGKEQKTVARFYDKQVAGYLKKLRKQNLRLITDDLGYDWLETSIMPEDKAAVEAFQTKPAEAPIERSGKEVANYVNEIEQENDSKIDEDLRKVIEGQSFKLDAIKIKDLLKLDKELADYVKKAPQQPKMDAGEAVLPIVVGYWGPADYGVLDGYNRVLAKYQSGDEYVEAFVSTGAPAIHPEDYKIMTDFIDYTRLKQEENIPLEIDARYLGNAFNINTDISNNALANRFERILSATPKYQEMSDDQRLAAEIRRGEFTDKLARDVMEEEYRISNAREASLEFADSEKEVGYQNFKQMAARRKWLLDPSTDDATIKNRLRGLNIDNFFFSGASDMTNNDLLELFKDRYEQEGVLSSIAKQKTPSEIDAEQKRIAQKKVKEATIGRKPTINQAIKIGLGIEQPQRITMKENTLLKKKIRDMARGVKMGRSDMRATMIDAFRTKQNDIQEIKKAIINYAQDLSLSEKGKLLTVVRDAQTQRDLTKAFMRIDAALQNSDRVAQIEALKDSAGDIKKALKNGKGIAVEYQKQILDILDGYDFKKPTAKTLAKLKSLQEYLKTNPDFVPDYVVSKLERLSKKNISTMSTDEIKELNQTVNHLVALGHLKMELKNNYDERQRKISLGKLLDGTKNIDPKGKVNEKSYAIKESGRRNLLNLKHSFRVTDQFDGYVDYKGPNTRLQQRINRAVSNAELTANASLDAIFDEIRAIKNNWSEKDQATMEFYLLVQQGAHTQANELATAQGWKKAPELTPDMEVAINLMRGAFQKTEDYLAAVYEEINNKPFERVDNYFPIKYEQRKGDIPEPTIGQKIFRTAKTEQGFTFKRLPNVKRVPRIDVFAQFEEAIREQQYFMQVQPTLLEVRNLVNDEAYKNKAGRLATQWWRDYIDAMANHGQLSGIRSNLWLRNKRVQLSRAILGYKLSSIIMQPMAIFDAVSYIQLRYGQIAAARTLLNFIDAWVNPFYARRVKKLSPAIALRNGGELAIEEIQQRATSKKIVDRFGRASMRLIQWADVKTAASVDQAVYKILKGQGLSNSEARAEADMVMNIVSGSSEIADRPMVLMEGEAMRTMFTFQTFMLNRWGLIAHDIVKSGLIKGSLGRKSKALYALFILALAGGVENELRKKIYEAITGGEIKEKLSFWANAFMSIPETAPILGQILQGMNSYGQGFDIPLLRVFEQAGQGAKLLTSDDPEKQKKGLLKLSEAVATYNGLPGAAQAGDIIQGSMAKEEKMKNDLGVQLPELPELQNIELPPLPVLPNLPTP